MKEFLIYPLSGIIAVICLVVYLHLKSYFEGLKYARQQARLYDCVSYIATLNKDELYTFVAREQEKLIRNFSARINTSDREECEIMVEILDAFRSDLSKRHYKNELIYNKAIKKMNLRAYFWYALEWYLSEHLSEKYFGRIKKYELINRIEYSRFSYDETYRMTKYGLVWYKLYYLSRLYLRDNGFNSFADWNHSTAENIIINREITFSSGL